MKKIILILILTVTAIRCELLNPSEWEKTSQYRRERGEKCYKYPSGYVHCEYTK